MSDLEKLLSDCNNLKMLRNQVTMDGQEIQKRKDIIDSWHTDKTWIKAYNEFRELEQQLSNSISKDELRGLIDEYNRESENVSKQEFALNDLIEGLNKLLEGDNNE